MAEEPSAATSSRAERDDARRRRVREASERPAAPARRAGTVARPPAPWGSFPLTELCIFLALVLGILGLVFWGERGRTMLLAAMALGSLGGLELSIREHFAGYRSHSALLAAATAFAVSAAVLLAAGTTQLGPVLIMAALVFAGAFWALRQLFKSRSGGLGFR